MEENLEITEKLKSLCVLRPEIEESISCLCYCLIDFNKFAVYGVLGVLLGSGEVKKIQELTGSPDASYEQTVVIFAKKEKTSTTAKIKEVVTEEKLENFFMKRKLYFYPTKLVEVNKSFYNQFMLLSKSKGEKND